MKIINFVKLEFKEILGIIELKDKGLLVTLLINELCIGENQINLSWRYIFVQAQNRMWLVSTQSEFYDLLNGMSREFLW